MAESIGENGREIKLWNLIDMRAQEANEFTPTIDEFIQGIDVSSASCTPNGSFCTNLYNWYFTFTLSWFSKWLDHQSKGKSRFLSDISRSGNGVYCRSNVSGAAISFIDANILRCCGWRKCSKLCMIFWNISCYHDIHYFSR